MVVDQNGANLCEYRAKRRFERTTEPIGGARPVKRAERVFVVHKHAARRLHYDLRLQIGGVLKSWAVPKGPSLDPETKRLAVMTEDHPLEYAHFEGRIPAGEYGAGDVIVWDIGTYKHRTEKRGRRISAERAVEAGHMSFDLFGAKLHGRWTLVQVTSRSDGKQWLLFKGQDEWASPTVDIVARFPTSILSDRIVDAS